MSHLRGEYCFVGAQELNWQSLDSHPLAGKQEKALQEQGMEPV